MDEIDRQAEIIRRNEERVRDRICRQARDGFASYIEVVRSDCAEVAVVEVQADGLLIIELHDEDGDTEKVAITCTKLAKALQRALVVFIERNEAEAGDRA